MNEFLISIVVPCYNEAKNLPLLVERLQKTLLNQSLEILLINDGSTDKTQQVIEWLAEQNATVHYLSFSRNFGQQMALKAGIENATGDAVVTMDADLQHPPEVIPKMIDLWQEGNQIINAVREKQAHPSYLKRWSSRMYYRLLGGLADDHLSHTGSDFRLIDRKISTILKQMPEKDLYLRGLFAWMGFQQITLPYVENERQHGKSKYTFKKMLHLAGNGITAHSIKPLRIALIIGVVFAISAFFYGLYAIGAVFLGHTVPGWASMVVASMFLAGVQLLVLGVMGEYLGKLYIAAKQRPDYLIAKTNIGQEPTKSTNEKIKNSKTRTFKRERRSFMT